MTRLLVLRPHTHAGKAYAPGDAIAVSPHIADWLIANGIARLEATEATRSALDQDVDTVGAAVASPIAPKTNVRIKEPKA